MISKGLAKHEGKSAGPGPDHWTICVTFRFFAFLASASSLLRSSSRWASPLSRTQAAPKLIRRVSDFGC